MTASLPTPSHMTNQDITLQAISWRNAGWKAAEEQLQSASNNGLIGPLALVSYLLDWHKKFLTQQARKITTFPNMSNSSFIFSAAFQFLKK